ncbi:branched-chain amino acid aminotransferase II [Lindgomyces ingoldianus]|uniref:Branched-chain amino acid aminotransferase II n=1 Tax=Lindgomyces ingoldianus TaxID=673940 RepID=A0ACB6R2D5_9PLEO|nr:branched-chain amino acid aminotransferase II [Lindgomyces ingoldianus]KAF2472677.1 branched-chain amino acid aminotransferase II [Lindgomyces ingoldianus]
MSTTQAFPPPPKEDIDWAKLGASAVEDDGHAECQYDAKTGCWSEPVLVKDAYIKVHGLAPGLNYGMQAYEGMKAYRSPEDQIYVFRPADHAARMVTSCATVSIPAIPPPIFLRAVNLAVARNARLVPPHASPALLYIRPVAFACDAHLALTRPQHFRFAVYVAPATAYHGVAASSQDVLVMESFDRAAPRGTGHAKVGGNYAPVVRWSDDAKARGFGLTLHLDSRTQTEVEEFSTSGFVGVRCETGGRRFVLTVPDSESIVASVTSDSVLALARAKGWGVEKRRIHFSELRYFSEVFALGTAAALVPIKSITRESTGDKFVFNGGNAGPGPCATELTHALTDMLKGRSSDEFGWRVRVQDVPESTVLDAADGVASDRSDVYDDRKSLPALDMVQIKA